MSMLGSQHGQREEILEFGGLNGGINNSVDVTKVPIDQMVEALNMYYDVNTGKLRTRLGLGLNTTLPIAALDSMYIGVASGDKKLVCASSNLLYEIRDDAELNEMVAEMVRSGDTNEAWAENSMDNATWANELSIVWSGSTAIRMEFLSTGYQCKADISLNPKDGCSDTFGTPILGFGDQKVGYNEGAAFLRHTNWGRQLQNQSGTNYRFRYLSIYGERGSAWTPSDILVTVWNSTLTENLGQVTLLEADIPLNGAPDWISIDLDTIINIPDGEYFYITLVSTVTKTLTNDYLQLYTPYDGGVGIWSDVPSMDPIGHWDRSGSNSLLAYAYDKDSGTYAIIRPQDLPSVRTERIVPTSDISNNYASGGWEEVNEKTGTDANLMYSGSASLRRAEFTIESVPTFLPVGNTPKRIDLNAAFRSASATPGSVAEARAGIRVNGSWYYTNWLQMGPLSGVSTAFGFSINPNTGLPWEIVDLNTIDALAVESVGSGSFPAAGYVDWVNIELLHSEIWTAPIHRVTFGGDSGRNDQWNTEPAGPTIATLNVIASRTKVGSGEGDSWTVTLSDSLDNVLATIIPDGNTLLPEQTFQVDVSAYLGDIADLRVNVMQTDQGDVDGYCRMQINEIFIDFDQSSAGWGPPTAGYGPVCVLTMNVGEVVGRDLYTGYPSDTALRFALRCSETDDVELLGTSYVRFMTDASNYAEYELQAGDLDENGYVFVSILRGGVNGDAGGWDTIVGTPDFRNITEVLFHFENTPSGAFSIMYIDYLHLYSAAAVGAFEIGNLSGSLPATFANFIDVTGNEAIFIASGGVLQYWSGAGELKNVNASPNCSIVVIKSGRVFVNDLDEPDVVRGSGILESEEWNYPLGVFAQAGWPDGDDVIGMHVIGDDLIIFKGSVHKRVVRLVGVYPKWQLKEVARGTSVMNHYSKETVGGTTLILDKDGINTLEGIDKYGEMQVSPVSDVLGSGIISRVDNTGFMLTWPVNACILVKPSASDDRLFLLHYDVTPEGKIGVKWTPWEFQVPNISCGVYDYETDVIYLGTSDGNIYTLNAALFTDGGSTFPQLIKTKVLYEPGRQLLLKELILDYNELSPATLEVLLLTDRGETEIVLRTEDIEVDSDQTIRIDDRVRSRNLQFGLRITGGGGIELSELIARVAVVGRD